MSTDPTIISTTTVVLEAGSRITTLEPSIMGMAHVQDPRGAGSLAIASVHPSVLRELADALNAAAAGLEAKHAALEARA